PRTRPWPTRATSCPRTSRDLSTASTGRGIGGTCSPITSTTARSRSSPPSRPLLAVDLSPADPWLSLHPRVHSELGFSLLLLRPLAQSVGRMGVDAGAFLQRIAVDDSTDGDAFISPPNVPPATH